MEYYKEYILKNGNKLIVRSAEIKDANGFAMMSNTTHTETDFLSYSSSEISYLGPEEIPFIQKMKEGFNTVLLIAEYDGIIVGNANLSPQKNYLWRRHIASFGISIMKDYWGLGIAGKLMLSIIECAKNMRYEQIRLSIVSENTRALDLYKSFDFEICGTIKDSYKFSKTHYADEYIMTKKIK